MVSGFEIIGSNKALQEHWLKRIVAAIIDSMIVFIPLYIIFTVVLWATIWSWGWRWFLGWTLWLVYGLIFFLYFVLLEASMKASIGKKLMGLQIVSTTGAPASLGGVFLRNLSKIVYLHWLDAVLGLATQGDPRQKYSDRMANLTVTRTDAQAYVEEQFRQMQYVPPHPQVQPGAWGQPQPGPQPYQQYPQQQAPPPAQQPPPGGWPQQSGGWSPGQQPAPSQWPEHRWDEHGQLVPPARFCSSCGGQLAPRGDGRMTCVRCGLVY